VPLQGAGEFVAGELAALIGVEDLGSAIPSERLLERLDTELGAERVGQSPRQHRAAHPVHDDHQIEIPLGHRDVGDVRAPNLIDPVDGDPRGDIDRFCARLPVCSFSGVGRSPSAQQPHQTLDPFAIDNMALVANHAAIRREP